MLCKFLEYIRGLDSPYVLICRIDRSRSNYVKVGHGSSREWSNTDLISIEISFTAKYNILKKIKSKLELYVNYGAWKSMQGINK